MGRHSSAGRRGRGMPVAGWAVLTAIWLVVIFGHSLVGGEDSSRESLAVVEAIRPVLEALGLGEVRTMTFVVRKCAHFLEYAVLGVLLGQVRRAALRGRGSTDALVPVALSVACGCLVPVLDESLQLLVPGRSGQLTDVLLDLAGVAAGTALAALVARARRRARGR